MPMEKCLVCSEKLVVIVVKRTSRAGLWGGGMPSGRLRCVFERGIGWEGSYRASMTTSRLSADAMRPPGDRKRMWRGRPLASIILRRSLGMRETSTNFISWRAMASSTLLWAEERRKL